MNGIEVETLAEVEAPYRRKVLLQEATYESGMKLLRMTLREGHRITIVDIDAEAANSIADVLRDWAARQPSG